MYEKFKNDISDALFFKRIQYEFTQTATWMLVTGFGDKFVGDNLEMLVTDFRFW